MGEDTIRFIPLSSDPALTPVPVLAQDSLNAPPTDGSAPAWIQRRDGVWTAIQAARTSYHLTQLRTDHCKARRLTGVRLRARIRHIQQYGLSATVSYKTTMSGAYSCVVIKPTAAFTHLQL